MRSIPMKLSFKALILFFFIVCLSTPSFATLTVDAGGPYEIYAGYDLWLQGMVGGSTSTGWYSDSGARFSTNPTGWVPWVTLDAINPRLPRNTPTTLTLKASDGASTVSDTAALTIWSRIPIAVLQTVATPVGSTLTLDASQSIHFGPATLTRYYWDLNPTSTCPFYTPGTDLPPPIWTGFESDFFTTSPILTLTPEQYASFYSSPGTYHPAVWIYNSNGDGTYAQQSLTMLAPVPVPPAVWLLGSGLIGLIGIRRRLKK